MDITTRGQLELVLLALLRRPAHGYALIEEMRAASGGALDVPEGSVYPALYRLERSGLVASSETAVNGRRRRVYRLTSEGAAALAERTITWTAETRIIGRILRGGREHVRA